MMTPVLVVRGVVPQIGDHPGLGTWVMVQGVASQTGDDSGLGTWVVV